MVLIGHGYFSMFHVFSHFYVCTYINTPVLVYIYTYLSYAEVVSETVVSPPSGIGQCYPSGLASTREGLSCVCAS